MGCGGTCFTTAAIAQLNPDSFVTNNGSDRAADAPHMHALPARLCFAGRCMTNTCATEETLHTLVATVHKTEQICNLRLLRKAMSIAASTMYNSMLLDISRFRTLRCAGTVVSHRFS